MIALNAAVAEQLARFKQDVDALIEKGEPKISAIIEIIRRYIKECKPVRFDGNGYSDEWKAEAAHRGLDCETSCPLIFDNYLKPASIAMFESTGVMTRKELEARNEVKWETYTKKIQIEARVLGDLAMNHIIPVATEYQSKLIDNVYKMKELFPAEKASPTVGREHETHRRDCPANHFHHRACKCHGGGAKSGEQNRERARKGHCLSRYHRPDAGRDTLSY